MLRNTPNNETIIVEYGFADSPGDDVNQIKNNWQELAEAVVRGLATYLGVPYIPRSGDESNYYTVKKGDSLYSIAQNYNTSVSELKSLNNLTSNNLSIGMTLKIPINQNIPSSDKIYIVAPGDSLWKIANMYGMSVNELKSLNNLNSNILNIGQKLVVANTEMPPANTYIVKPGDSLYSIAKKYNITVDNLKQANNKTNNLLTIGETLTIPTSDNNYYYTVKPGDSLWKISQNFNTTVDNIKQLNNLTTNNLAIGMKLKIK